MKLKITPCEDGSLIIEDLKGSNPNVITKEAHDSIQESIDSIGNQGQLEAWTSVETIEDDVTATVCFQTDANTALVLDRMYRMAKEMANGKLLKRDFLEYVMKTGMSSINL